jgi:hypothetical protein
MRRYRLAGLRRLRQALTISKASVPDHRYAGTVPQYEVKTPHSDAGSLAFPTLLLLRTAGPRPRNLKLEVAYGCEFSPVVGSLQPG